MPGHGQHEIPTASAVRQVQPSASQLFNEFQPSAFQLTCRLGSCAQEQCDARDELGHQLSSVLSTKKRVDSRHHNQSCCYWKRHSSTISTNQYGARFCSMLMLVLAKPSPKAFVYSTSTVRSPLAHPGQGTAPRSCSSGCNPTHHGL